MNKAKKLISLIEDWRDEVRDAFIPNTDFSVPPRYYSINKSGNKYEAHRKDSVDDYSLGIFPTEDAALEATWRDLINWWRKGTSKKAGDDIKKKRDDSSTYHVGLITPHGII